MSEELMKNGSASIFTDLALFKEVGTIAKTLSMSSIVPESYRGNENVPNVLIALEMAIRMKTSPMQVMQNLYVVNGRPAWSSQYIIAVINSSGKYKHELKFELTGKGETLACYAWTTDKDGEKLVGPRITWQMAVAEGWIDRKGSKWKTMPEVMMRYRAASFFGRLYCSDLIMGIYAEEETQSAPSFVTVESVEREAQSEIAANANRIPIATQQEELNSGETAVSAPETGGVPLEISDVDF
jgi:hypothetical protein